MRAVLYLVMGFVLSFATAAVADPVGVYNSAGNNPGNGYAYSGTVGVERNGATYTVVWDIGGTKFIGTGVGAANVKGSLTFGDAAENDTAIAVSYVSGNSFGLALFVEQENGSWKGIWTFGGSSKIGNETWTPRN